MHDFVFAYDDLFHVVSLCRAACACAVCGKTVLGFKMLCRAMSHHGRGEHPCQLCNATLLPEDETVLDHILAKHKQYLHLGDSVMDSAELIDLLRNLHVEILSKFKSIFRPF